MNNYGDEEYSGGPSAARAGDPASLAGEGVAVAAGNNPDEIRNLLAGKFVCPFCGSINESEQGVCPRCTMENSPASRKATKSRIGPWYVLQTRNPAAPGMKFETLLNFAKKGRVKPRSIVRGPTTHQLWKFAAQVKGVSREFGVCYSCGGPIDATTSLCPQCNRLQDPPPNPDVLLEIKDAPVLPAAQRPSRVKEPDLAEVDAEFVIPALGGTVSDDSVSGVSLTGSMAGVAFDPIGSARSERPAPQSLNNGNGASPGGTRNKKDEGFLTPRDLAAAFRLNFAPQDGDGADAAGTGPAAGPAAGSDRRRAPRAPVDRQGPGGEDRNTWPPRDARSRDPRQRLQHPLDFQPYRPELNPSPATPSFDGDRDEALALSRPPRKPPRGKPGPQPRRRHVALKVIVFLVLLGGTIFGLAIWVDPTLRQQSFQALRAWTGMGKKAGPVKPASGHKVTIPPDSSDPTDPAASAVLPDPGDTHTTKPLPSMTSAAPDRGSDAQPASASSDGAGAVAPSGSPSTKPAAADGVANVPSAGIGQAPPAVAAMVPPPAEPTAPPVAPPVPAVDASVESLRLYRLGLSLEASDPARALSSYLAIKKFPKEDWPADLDACIGRAQAQLKLRQH